MDEEKTTEDFNLRGFRDKRANAFNVPVSIKIMNDKSLNYSVIEVSGKDRPGILYNLAKELNELNLTLFRAQVATFGERVVDVFYVLDASNQRIMDRELKISIIKKLSKIFEE